MSAPTQVADALPIHAAAVAMARKWNLVNGEGQVVCIKGCGRLALLPSLCCKECLQAHRRGYR